jgi:hypothetical protein
MKLSMSTLGKNGRLGNMLFQVSSMLGLSEKYGADLALPYWEYERYFEIDLPHGEPASQVVNEEYFHHYDWNLTGDSDIHGYLQSYKYFGSRRLTFREGYLRKCRSHLDLSDKETICIHVRRGDYVNNPNYWHTPIEYYLSALMLHFPHWREMNILVISDDIEYCRVHFEALPNVYFYSSRDIEDMALASMCDHFIIGNSSYAWWCAWLGKKPHSRIVYPGHHFAGKLSRNSIEDYYPPDWICHKLDDYRMSIPDLTVTIPVHYDHEYRRQNFSLSLGYLLRSFQVPVIVSEQGGAHFADLIGPAQYLKHRAKQFHRTRMLNEMAIQAQTPYVVNWDCDVILPPTQILMGIELLRRGADMVYPYDGRFARMPRGKWMEIVQGAQDIGIVGNAEFKGREAGHFSLGGAVMFNKQSFIRAGMENENFISFGPEDVERYERFKKLGYRIERVPGILFHMNHYVGNDSSPRNPYFVGNTREYEKEKIMDEFELTEYVKSWEWIGRYNSDKV